MSWKDAAPFPALPALHLDRPGDQHHPHRAVVAPDLEHRPDRRHLRRPRRDHERPAGVVGDGEQGLSRLQVDQAPASIEAHPHPARRVQPDRGAVRQLHEPLFPDRGGVDVARSRP